MPGTASENQRHVGLTSLIVLRSFSSEEAQQMRIAATADLHFVPSSPAILHDQLSKVREEADVLVLAGTSRIRICQPKWDRCSMPSFEYGCPQWLSWEITITRAG